MAPSWLDADTVVVGYVSLADHLDVFVMTRRRSFHWRAAVARVALALAIKDALAALARTAAWSPDHRSLRHLADLCQLDEVVDALPASGARPRRIIFVPDGVLFQAPFAALPARGKALIQWASLQLQSSFDWSLDAPVRHSKGLARVCVGVPSSPAAPNYRRLEHVEQEVREIGSRLPRGLVLSSTSATRDAVCAAVTDAQILHLACHGDFHPRGGGLRAGLLLHDGWLYEDEVGVLASDRLRVVVGAACWSANVELLPGRLLSGLPGAFFKAGADHVIGSLWELDDEGGARLMKSLHDALDLSAPAESLAALQRRALEPRPGDEEVPAAVWSSLVCFSRAMPLGTLRRWWQRFRRAGANAGDSRGATAV